MIKALFLIVPNGFRDEEYSIPKEIFERNNIQVITSSSVGGKLTGKKGLTTANVDILLKDVAPSDYDTVVIVGGQKTFWDDPKIIQILQELNRKGKPIGAICSSAVLPAQAGLMQGKNGTAFPGPEELRELEKHQVIYRGNAVETAGNIVTANGPEAAENFAKELVKLLKKS